MEINRDLILKNFLVESTEGLSLMEQSILELETHPNDGELIQTVFRVVHTLKGNAGLLQIESLLAFTHNVEDLLDTVRNGQMRQAHHLWRLPWATRRHTSRRCRLHPPARC